MSDKEAEDNSVKEPFTSYDEYLNIMTHDKNESTEKSEYYLLGSLAVERSVVKFEDKAR